jgi:hypothetical protein
MRFLGVGILVACFACSSNDSDSRSDDESTGGDSGTTGGRTSTGSGGAETTGGRTSSGGTAPSGGKAAQGGRANTGGSSATGGGRATGGSAATGGGTATGGSAGSAPTGSCGEIPTFADGLTPERVVDIAAGGDLESALAAATPGTAVRLGPGSYDGGAFLSGLTGTEEAPIWVGGEPGQEKPVIQGGANALQLSNASYVILHDLEITGQTANGLNIDDGGDATDPAHHLIFRDLLIRNIGSGGNQDCLKLSGVDDYVVLDSEFIGCSGGSAIDQVGCHDGLVARNLFSDLGGNGVQTKGGSARIRITRNRFMNAGERAVNLGGSTGFEFFRPALSSSEPNAEARDIQVVANFFFGGISPIAFVGCVDCLAANNTLLNPERWVARILQETTTEGEFEFTPASNGRFLNNIVMYERANLSTHVNVGADTDPDSFEFANNLWYASDAPDQSEPDLPVAETDGIYGQSPNLIRAPAEVGIPAASPAAGTARALAEVTADLEGVCYEDPPSIGAREHN